MPKLSEILKNRGYVHQFSSETLEEITDPPAGGKRTIYLGVDPTADSIHVGNLVAYMVLRRFADAGHRIILIVGGGTGLIGDPKPDVERPLLDMEEVQTRAARLGKQAQKLLGESKLTIINNHDWLGQLELIPFLRDVGKYFTVNSLMKKDAISARLKSEEGISYTEFAYPLLQAYDLWHLFKTEKCDVQIGGSDQWGNIVAGVELIRRKENAVAYALTTPIVTDKATGKKFGKSEDNAVWLDAEKTSPFEFYQFWLNASDESVADYLKLFTLLGDMEMAAVMEMHRHDPAKRHAQRLLAREVTKLVHGEKESEKVESVSAVLFGDADASTLDKKAIAVLVTVAPSHTIQIGDAMVGIPVAGGLATSRREARQFLSDGAISLNATVVEETKVVEESDLVNGIAILRRGKRNVCVLTLK